MKKSIILVFMVFMLTLAGCSKSQAPSGDVDGDKEMKDLKLAAFFGGPRGDSGIVDMVANTLEAIAKENDMKVDIVEGSDGSSVDIAKLTSGLLDLADGGYDLILIQGSSINDVVAEVAPSYPKTTFMIFDTVFDFETHPLENVYAASFKQNEGAYLAGALAMLQSDNKSIGFVGGQEVTVILDFMWGFVEGGQYIDPTGKINIAFTGDWYNSAKTKEIALTIVNLGSDVLFPAAGPSSEGLMEAGYEKDVWTIGVDIDRAKQYKDTNANWATKIVSSEMKMADVAARRAIELYLSGELKSGANEYLGIKEGGIGIVKDDNYNKFTTEETRNKIEEIEKKIISGEITVGTAYDKSAEEIQKLKDSTK